MHLSSLSSSVGCCSSLCLNNPSDVVLCVSASVCMSLLYELSVRFSLVDLELSLLLPCLNSFSYVYIFYLWKWNYIWNAFINIYIAYLLWKCSFLPEGLFPNISYCPHHMVPHGGSSRCSPDGSLVCYLVGTYLLPGVSHSIIIGMSSAKHLL